MNAGGTNGEGKMVIRRSLSWARLRGEETRARYFPSKNQSRQVRLSSTSF
jgi:hypothetical protein